MKDKSEERDAEKSGDLLKVTEPGGMVESGFKLVSLNLDLCS